MNLRKSNLNASSNLPAIPSGGANENRKISEWLRKRGLERPFNGTLVGKRREKP